jgi:hypothetical protein
MIVSSVIKGIRSVQNLYESVFFIYDTKRERTWTEDTPTVGSSLLSAITALDVRRSVLCVISGFRHAVGASRALQGYYAAIMPLRDDPVNALSGFRSSKFPK